MRDVVQTIVKECVTMLRMLDWINSVILQIKMAMMSAQIDISTVVQVFKTDLNIP